MPEMTGFRSAQSNGSKKLVPDEAGNGHGE